MNVTDPITRAHLGFGESIGTRREVFTMVRLTHAGPLDALLLLTDRATGQDQGFLFTYEATKDLTLEDFMDPRPRPAS